MIHRTRGVVFRTIKFSETSVVSKIYTEKFGMQSYIINSVRSPKAKTKAALLQAMSMLEMEVYHHENRNLHRIREMQPMYLYRTLLFDPLKSSVGLFMIEVLSKCIHEEEGNEKVFSFIAGRFQALDRAEKVPVNFLLNFLLQLAALLGFSPHGTSEAVNPLFDLQEGIFVAEGSVHPLALDRPISEKLSSLLQDETAELSAAERRNLLDALLQYYRLHVPNFTVPKSLKVLEEVFRS
jgi:DNA repair protein RecO (recombination protein O)